MTEIQTADPLKPILFYPQIVMLINGRSYLNVQTFITIRVILPTDNRSSKTIKRQFIPVPIASQAKKESRLNLVAPPDAEVNRSINVTGVIRYSICHTAPRVRSPEPTDVTVASPFIRQKPSLQFGGHML